MSPRTRYERNTAAGVIVFRRDGERCRFLLLLSRGTRRPLWEFPKGGVDDGEGLIDAALRELREETGLHGPDIRLIDGFQRREAYRFTLRQDSGDRVIVRKQVTYFLAEALRFDIVISESETLASQWMALETAMRRVRYSGRRRMLAEAATLAGCGPLDQTGG